MDLSQRSHVPAAASLPVAVPAHRRIAIPLARVLDFARHEPDSHPTRQLASALRPLLGVALATAGFGQGLPPGAPAPRPARRGEPELMFDALSSLVEVVKSLTPSAGKLYAHLGHEAVADSEDPEEDGAAAPRSEVVIELVSSACTAYEELSPAIHAALGALAFELAVVAAIVESKGGQLSLGEPGGPSRSFTVRLPVSR
jgi:hypothetical protein